MCRARLLLDFDGRVRVPLPAEVADELPPLRLPPEEDRDALLLLDAPRVFQVN
jgi:hypothetical protein